MDDTLAERIEVDGGYVIEIHYDRDPCDPREDDNVGTMVCEHKRYTLGDKDARDAAIEAVRNSRDFRPSWDDEYTYADPPALWALVQKCSDIISFPLYLYDHGGITMSASKFSCPWDSGQIGFMFCTRAKALQEFGGFGPQSKLTAAMRERAVKSMLAEVETYDQYLTGDVYRFTVERNGEEIESVSGYFGIEYAKECAMEVVNGDKASASSSCAAQDQEAAPA